MAKLHDMRLKLLIQQEHERISKSQPNDLEIYFSRLRFRDAFLFLLNQ